MKVPPNIITVLEETTKVRLIFCVPKDWIKRQCYDFSDYKQRNKVCLLYLECQLQQDRYG